MRDVFLATMMALLLAVSPAWAADNQWQGINTDQATSLADDDVEDTALWSLAGVPTAGDRAYFDFNDTVGDYREDLVIPATSAFAPDNWWQGVGPWNGCQAGPPVYLLKDLEITDIKFVYGYSSGGQGDEVLRLGASNWEALAWLQMTSTDVGFVTGTTNVAGPLGNADIDFTAAAGDKNAIAAAINAETATTGVAASTSWERPTAGGVYIYAAPDPNNPTVDPVITFTPGAGAIFSTSRHGHADPDNSATGYHVQSVTLTVTGQYPWDYTEGGGSDQRNICMAQGSKLVFSNAAVILQQQNQSPSNNAGPGHNIAGTGGSVEFPAEAGSVQLDDPGVRRDGNLRMGDHTLKLRSDQTWTNSSGLGFVRAGCQTYTIGTASFSAYGSVNPPFLGSLDAGALNNLGAVPFYIDGNERATQDRELGVACTLQSLNVNYHAATSPQTVRLSGDTVLTGGIVIPGDHSSTPGSIDNDWSLRINAYGRNKTYFNCQGHSLTMAKGLYLYKPSGDDFRYGRGVYRFDCEGSTVTVGGDIKIEDVEGNPAVLGVGLGCPWMGIEGGGSGATVVCSGNYWSNCGPMTASGYEGLTASTLTMLGTTKTLECMGNPADDPDGDPGTSDFDPGTSAIGTVNIGDGGTAASIQLADANVNDAGGSEVLLVGSLNIVNGTLDCNGKGIKIGPSTLSISGSGILDLNSGQVLVEGVPYTKVFGMGNQADAWNAFKAQVGDSSNPDLDFEAVYVDGDGKTYWQPAAAGAPLEVTAALAAGEDWVYQNTQTTTADRHTSLATITLVSEASPGEVYNVSVADDGPGGANFTLGAITDNRPGEQTLTVPVIGGRVGVGTPGTGGAAYTVTLTVQGQTSTESDTADVSLALRYIGDVDGSGAPGAQDKQFFNQRLNNVATAYPDRCYDLNGSGGAPNAEDKQVMNQVLNGVALP